MRVFITSCSLHILLFQSEQAKGAKVKLLVVQEQLEDQQEKVVVLTENRGVHRVLNKG